jgi:hypothetical protein
VNPRAQQTAPHVPPPALATSPRCAYCNVPTGSVCAVLCRGCTVRAWERWDAAVEAMGVRGEVPGR